MIGNPNKQAPLALGSGVPGDSELEWLAEASVSILDDALQAMALIRELDQRISQLRSPFSGQALALLGACAESIESICRVACQLRLRGHERGVLESGSVREPDLHSRPTERPPSRSP